MSSFGNGNASAANNGNGMLSLVAILKTAGRQAGRQAGMRQVQMQLQA
jgi:hypothetical protein